MLIPVRCFTCGSPAVSARWLEYRRRLADEDAEAVLDALGIRRYCCRTVMLCQPDLVETILSQTTPSVHDPRPSFICPGTQLSPSLPCTTQS